MELRAVKGTRDILPEEAGAWQRVEEAARRTFARYGFREIRTPIFEPTDLFSRSTGSDTDIVTKEMYTFEDRGGRSVTLRPEGTPGVVRAAIEHSLLRRGEVERFYYIGPMFRYERPQKGRSRQFSQIGVEAFGSAHPAVDAETMEMVLALFGALDVGPVVLEINSVGHAGCRPAYRQALREALMPHRDQLCPDCVRRLDVNPLRILDCKVPSCAPIKELAPTIEQFLCAECRSHLGQLREILESLSVPFVSNPRLVRGLDYYTRTTFEVTSQRLGAQNALCGGGRYDDLVASMGGLQTPAFGFAIGADRLVLAAGESAAAKSGCDAGGDVYIVHLGSAALVEGLLAARSLRGLGLSCRLEPDARDLKKQMSKAGADGSRYVLLIGDRELEKSAYSLKRMADGEQKEIVARDWEAIRREVARGGA